MTSKYRVGGYYVGLGDGEYSGKCSAVFAMVTADAFGRDRAPAASEIILVYGLRWHRVGGPQDNSFAVGALGWGPVSNVAARVVPVLVWRVDGFCLS